MKKKIIRNTMFLTLLVLVLTFLAVTALMYTHSLNILMNGTQHEAETLKIAVEENGIDFLEKIHLEGQEQRITVIQSDGQVVYDSDVDVSILDNHKQRAEVAQAFHEGIGTAFRNSETLGQQVYYYAIQLEDGSVLRTSNAMDSFYYRILAMLPYMLLLMAFLIGMVIFTIHRETEKMVRPINSLDLDNPLEEPMYEELMPLLNRMDIQNKRLYAQMEELKQAEGMRREFSANVSHELKTPLMAISGYAEIISCNMVKPEDIPEFAGRIYKEAGRMTRLIDDIIKVSRLDEESDMLPFEAIRLKEMTVEVFDALQVLAHKHNIQMSLSGDEQVIEGVSQIVYEMLYNLCDNALKYNHDGGSVQVTIEKKRKGVCWSVRDTGIGIPKEEQERIFERFYCVDKSHSRETGGTGLGLAIVKHGAIIHDAQVSVESEFGVGTCISILFP